MNNNTIISSSSGRPRPTFTLTLRAEPDAGDPILALRGVLKVALRRFGLRCISAHEDTES